MADTMTTMKNSVQGVGNSLGQAAACAADNVRNAAGYVSETAKGLACTASKDGQQAASYLGHKAEDATAAVGNSLRAAGDVIRQNAPHDGTLGKASSAVARTLEETGDYLKREGLEGMACDMTNMVKKNPIPALFIAVGVGFLLARSTATRS